jgi:hypothetical protein
MNKTTVTAVAAFVFGTITSGVMISWAQPAGPPGGPPGGVPTGGPPPVGGPPVGVPPGAGGPGPMSGGPWRGQGQWGDRMHERQAHRMQMIRVFALVDRAEDRKLTPPDVQKIAEAFLLWNGNHTWKVINVKPEGDVIGFDLATAQSSVIAHFTMDPKTGRPTRAD